MCAQCAGHGAPGGQDIAPCIVSVGNNRRAGAVQDRNHVTLEVGYIIVSCAVVGDGHGDAVGFVGEVQRICTYSHLRQAAAVVDIVICGAAVGTRCSQAVGIVSVIPGSCAVRQGSKLPAMLPGEGFVSIGQRIANAVIDDGFAVIVGQQVAPIKVTVGIGLGGDWSTQCAGSEGVLGLAQDVSGTVIVPGPGFICLLVILPDQLILAVIHVRGGVCTVRDGRDIAITVIGVGNCTAASAGFHVLHQPAGQVIVVSGGNAGGRIGNGSQVTEEGTSLTPVAGTAERSLPGWVRQDGEGVPTVSVGGDDTSPCPPNQDLFPSIKSTPHCFIFCLNVASSTS